MNDLSTRVRTYLDQKKPALQAKLTPDVTIAKAELDQSIDELSTAWTEFKNTYEPIISLFKWSMMFVMSIVVIWAIAVVEIQNRCYLDKACSVEIERVNR